MVLSWFCPDCRIKRHPRSADFGVCACAYDVSAHVGSSSVEYRCCICLAHRGGERQDLCHACLGRWTSLRELERMIPGDRARDPASFIQQVDARRVLVGDSLQYRLDLLCVNLLMESNAGVAALVELAVRRQLRSVCKNGSDCLSLWSTNGKVDLSVSREARWAAHCEGERPAAGSRSTIPTDLRMQKVAAAAGLTALVLDGLITVLDVTGNSGCGIRRTASFCSFILGFAARVFLLMDMMMVSRAGRDPNIRACADQVT